MTVQPDVNTIQNNVGAAPRNHEDILVKHLEDAAKKFDEFNQEVKVLLKHTESLLEQMLPLSTRVTGLENDVGRVKKTLYDNGLCTKVSALLWICSSIAGLVILIVGNIVPSWLKG